MKNYIAWRATETSSGYLVNYHGTVLELTSSHLYVMSHEWHLWDRVYLPKFSLEGKTVLDVGGGSGETAFFYFLHGARKVIAVEPDPVAVGHLRRNAERNSWTLKILPRNFELRDLKLKYDFMKMDCEGCEELLLHGEHKLRPSVIEAHKKWIAVKLVRKLGLRLVRFWNEVWILAA